MTDPATRDPDVCSECGDKPLDGVDCATELCLSCFDQIFAPTEKGDFLP